jgi:hypothetical protein
MDNYGRDPMAINQELLKKARAAADRLAGTEHEVQLARTEYYSIIRRMHLAGGSLREISQALGISHQRVQQMVQVTGGSWWQRIWRSRNLKENLVCTFCKRSQNKVSKLIAGPNVYICDRCVAKAERIMTDSGIPTCSGFLVPVKEGSRARCSFCRKGRTADRQLLTGSAGNICGECLGVCRQVLQDSSDEVSVQS